MSSRNLAQPAFLRQENISFVSAGFKHKFRTRDVYPLARRGLVSPDVSSAPTIRVASIHRLDKGQSAPVVILTELDIETLAEKVARLLFVGLTRASMGVGLVLSERAQKAIGQRIDEA